MGVARVNVTFRVPGIYILETILLLPWSRVPEGCKTIKKRRAIGMSLNPLVETEMDGATSN